MARTTPPGQLPRLSSVAGAEWAEVAATAPTPVAATRHSAMTQPDAYRDDRDQRNAQPSGQQVVDRASRDESRNGCSPRQETDHRDAKARLVVDQQSRPGQPYRAKGDQAADANRLLPRSPELGECLTQWVRCVPERVLPIPTRGAHAATTGKNDWPDGGVSGRSCADCAQGRVRRIRRVQDPEALLCQCLAGGWTYTRVGICEISR